MKKTTTALALAMSAGLATSALARPNFPEVEPNETKGQATMVVGMAPGDTLSGNSTGTSTTVAGAASADTFLIKVAPAPLGLYRNRLVITTTGTAGHSGSIRGLNQVAAAQAPWLPGMVIGTPGVTDTTIQTSSATSTPPRFNQWYGFGKEEEIYYRVTGTASTTSDYLVTLEQLPIAPTPIASTFAPGDITITTLGQGHSSDTDIHVYDANFNPIVGSSNDDEAAAAVSGVPGATGATLQSALKRSYAPGTYYLAIGSFNTCNNLPSPSDDDFRTGAILDFPNALATSSTATNVNVAFSISDGVVTTPVPSTRAGIFDINWYSFTVGGVVGACCVPTTLTCVETSAGNCSILGGTYNGDGSTCATANCPTPGACCLPDGSCIQALPAACTAQNGTYQGNSVQCGSVQCPQPAL
ncbi:MAG: hypothetical protein JNM80_00085, partial [Phycisphaerae bacterium]|nr:hypothetical protein [Phycisphaerae bacterium]